MEQINEDTTPAADLDQSATVDIDTSTQPELTDAAPTHDAGPRPASESQSDKNAGETPSAEPGSESQDRNQPGGAAMEGDVPHSDEPGACQDISELVAEAERRGYIRGRAEAARDVTTLQAERGMLEVPRVAGEGAPAEPTILGCPRRSIWELA